MDNRLFRDGNTIPAQQENAGIFDIQMLDAVSTPYIMNGECQRLPRYEIFWFVRGNGTFTVDVESHLICDQQVFCLAPGQIRKCQTEGRVQGYYLSFSEDFLYHASVWKQGTGSLHPYTAVLSSSIVTADAQMQAELADITFIMKQEFDSNNLLRSEILSGLLYILSTYISRKLSSRQEEASPSKDGELVQRFMKLLRGNFITMKQVCDYASELCVSPNYLNRAVKKITGNTASAQIQHLIVMEAKKQAIHSTGSMKEIAYMLGFTDIAHFSKFFKNNSGVSFTRYRKDLVYAN